MFIFEKTFKQIHYFKERPISFVTWICPLLRPQVKTSNQYVYYEGDDVSCIYFLKKGNAGYVLPRYQNLMYIKMVQGQHFGISCIVGSIMEKGVFHIENWISQRDKLKRQFTIHCQDQCELLTLSIHDLNLMKDEFYDEYTQLF